MGISKAPNFVTMVKNFVAFVVFHIMALILLQRVHKAGTKLHRALYRN